MWLVSNEALDVVLKMLLLSINASTEKS